MSEPQDRRAVGSWLLQPTPIGAGSFAVVWRATHGADGREAAVKEINLSKLNAKLRQSLESEVSILKRIRHENIVQLHEVIEESDRLYLVMEYCAGGDLAHFLRRVKRVPEPVARHLMRQLAAGLREMWAHHLVHRDLKPQNLLLSAASPSATLKIADFGFARNLQPQGLAETLCGSPLYMAPEILHFHKYDAKADLWSVGAVLFELVAGRPPFTGANQLQLLRAIERGDAALPEGVAAALSPAGRHLIHALLRRNPVERLSFEEFFRHPFVATPQEAAAPLLRAAPLAGGAPPLPGAAASLAAAGGGGRRAAPPHTLLFGTSAPVAAGGGGRPRSAAAVPQQVMGFEQQRGHGQGQAAPPAAAPAVPLGGLSHQLKPRPGTDAPAVAQQQQQQQQQLAAPSAQRPPQPAPGHHLGAVQRTRGLQPAQQGSQLPPWAAAAAAQQGVAAAARPAARPLPAAVGSLHSEDDDYVLVDAALSAHAAAAVRPPSRHDSLPVSRAASAEGSLAGSRHAYASGEDDVFAAHPGDVAAAAGAPAPPWAGLSRWRFLQRVAHLAQSAGDAAQAEAEAGAPGGGRLDPDAHRLLRESLALHLAALQLLEAAMEAHAAAAAGANAAPVRDGGPHGAGAGADAAELAGGAAELAADAAAGMAAAEAAAGELAKAGAEPSPVAVAPAGAALAQAEAALPDAWELLYAAALRWGRDAAVDELLGSPARSCRLYARAGAALGFLGGEAAALQLEPPVRLSPGDQRRLQRYAAATAARWAACAAATAAAGPATPAGRSPAR